MTVASLKALLAQSLSKSKWLGAIACAIASLADASPYQAWDWLPAEQLSKQQRCQIKTGCSGAYITPAIDWPDSDKEPGTLPLHAGANQSDMSEDTVILTGEVVLSKGQRRILADKASLDRSSNELTMEGNVVIREPNLLMRCEAGKINTDTGLGYFTEARILDYTSGMRIQAGSMARPNDHIFNFEQALYTQCPPDSETWALDADNLSLDQSTGWGTAENMVLRIKDVPVFYVPYATFPIDDRRKSGFLWPTIASDDGALDLSLPYYLNIAPNADATITPRHIGKHGDLLELETRYLNQYSSWVVGGAYIDNDEATDQKRWLGLVQEDGQFNHHWSHSVDYTKVSDQDYFRDFSLNSLNAKRNNHIKQSGALSFNALDWQASLLVEDHQTLDSIYNSPYKRLPQIMLSNQTSAENFSPDLIFLAQITEFDHEEAKDKGGSFDSGQRQYTELGVSFPMRWAPGFIIPTAKLRHVSYQLDGLSETEDNSPQATVPMASLDAGLFFERNTLFNSGSYTQTLEPRLYHLYSDYEDQANNPDFDSKALTFSYNQLFRDTRFSGHDRLDDANQTSIGITSRFIENESGIETFTLSVGQIFYWDDRRIHESASQAVETADTSAIATEIQYQPNKNIWLNSTALWDSRQDKLQEFGLSSQYQNSKILLNAGYRYKRNNIVGSSNEELEQADISAALPIIVGNSNQELEQADISAALPVNDQWRLMARFQYDIKEDRSLEDLFGLEYQDCCWLTRIVYQRADKRLSGSSLETSRDHKIVLQFQLKGLGGIGNKAIKIIEESILGYNDRE
ncbi:MAG: LPS-assembly protein [Pseudohongiellaceae bacterium]|jgi:LPS-assembly protein